MQPTRRSVLRAIAAFAAVAPLRAYGGPARIGWLSNERDRASSAVFDTFMEGMRELGYLEGRDLELDTRWADGSNDRLEQLAFALVAGKPDLIVAAGAPALLAVKSVGARGAVVFSYAGDPTELGLVDSVERPGQNYTGVSLFAIEFARKRLEFLKEVIPGLERIAIITNPDHPGQNAELRATRAAGAALNIGDELYIVRNTNALRGVFSVVPRARTSAVIVFPESLLMSYSERFARFALRTRIPCISGWAEFAERGNLMTYGPNVRASNRRMAYLADKVLHGEKPADLPIELPTMTEFVINLKTAKALGIELPAGLVQRADRLIE